MARIQQSIEINVPVHAAYRQLTQFEEYPRFMEGVEEVRQIDPTHLRWHTRMPDHDEEWDAEITEQVPDRCIAWRNTSGPKYAGRMELQATDKNKTEVRLSLDIDAHGQPPEPGQDSLLDVAARRTEQDLARLKQFIETGKNRAPDDSAGERARAPAHLGYVGETDTPPDGPPSASLTEGWDGNEDPGVAVSAGLVPDQSQQEAERMAFASPPESPPQQDGGSETPVSLSRAGGVEPDRSQPPVAEEQSFDQQSGQARRVGRMPDGQDLQRTPGQSDPAEAVAQSLRPERQQASEAYQSGGMMAPEVPVRTEAREARETSETTETKDASPQAGPSWLPNIRQAWEDPFTAMRRMSEEMDQFIGKYVGRPLQAARMRAGGGEQPGTWTPPLEITQRDNQLIVSAELPGVRLEDVQVEIRNDRLIIEGDRREEPRAGQQGYRRTERSYGHFYRSVSLPEGVDADAASASLRDGMLEVVVPVSHGGRPGRRLEIRTPQ